MLARSGGGEDEEVGTLWYPESTSLHRAHRRIRQDAPANRRGSHRARKTRRDHAHRDRGHSGHRIHPVKETMGLALALALAASQPQTDEPRILDSAARLAAEVQLQRTVQQRNRRAIQRIPRAAKIAMVAGGVAMLYVAYQHVDHSSNAKMWTIVAGASTAGHRGRAARAVRGGMMGAGRAHRLPTGAPVGAGHDGPGAAGPRRRTATDDRAHDRQGA